MNGQRLFWLLSLALLPCVAFGAEAQANNALDQFVEAFKGTKTWEASLAALAERMFLILATIQICWSGMQLALKGGEAQDWIATIGREVLILGFFYTLLFQYLNWTGAITDFFNQGQMIVAGQDGLRPSNVLERGVNLGLRLVRGVELLDAATWAKVIAAFIVLYAFSLTTATVIMTLVESYLIISAGVLFLGFGGSSWTQEYALKFLRYALGIGAKLFTLQLVITTGVEALSSLEILADDLAGAFFIVAGALVLLTLTNTLPDMVQQMLTGTSSSSGRALVQAAGSAAMAASLAKNVVAESVKSPAGMAALAGAAGSQASQAFSAAKVGGLGNVGASGAAAASGVGVVGQAMAQMAAGNIGSGTFGGRAAGKVMENAQMRVAEATVAAAEAAENAGNKPPEAGVSIGTGGEAGAGAKDGGSQAKDEAAKTGGVGGSGGEAGPQDSGSNT